MTRIWPVSVTLAVLHKCGLVCDTTWVAQIHVWPVSVTPVGWRKHCLCLWHQLCGTNLACVCDTICVAQMWPVSVIPTRWCRDMYGLCLWHHLCGTHVACVCDTNWVAQIHVWPESVAPVRWRKHGLCLWHQLGDSNMACVCDTICVAHIWPVSVTPTVWRKDMYDLCLWHQLNGGNTRMACVWDISWVTQTWPVSVTPAVWHKCGVCLWHHLCDTHVACVCDTNWVAPRHVWPVSVTPVEWRKYNYGLCLWHQLVLSATPNYMHVPLADRLAKEAARSNGTSIAFNRIPVSTLYYEAAEEARQKWQDEWTTCTKAATTKQYFPTVQDRLRIKINLTPNLAAMLTGHGRTRGIPQSLQTTWRRNVHLWTRRPNNGPHAEPLHNDSHTEGSSKTMHT